MAKDYNNKTEAEPEKEGDLEKLSESELKKPKIKKWTGIFEDVKYGSGPGDNIYVYG